MRLVVALAVWAAAVLAAVVVSSAVAGSIHHSPNTSSTGGVSISFGGSSGGGAGGGSSGGGSAGSPSIDPSSVKATDRASMFRAATFTPALNAARKQLGANARIEEFVIYPGYLSVQAAKGNTEATFYAAVNGQANVSTGGTPGGTGTFPLSKISPGAPPALVAKITRAAHIPASQLHYMVADADPISNRFQWLVYTTPTSRVEYFKTSGIGAPLFAYRKNSSTGLQRVGR
jgi:hypothetical protein